MWNISSNGFGRKIVGIEKVDGALGSKIYYFSGHFWVRDQLYQNIEHLHRYWVRGQVPADRLMLLLGIAQSKNYFTDGQQKKFTSWIKIGADHI